MATVMFFYLGNSRAGISANCLDAFGIVHWLLLVWSLVHVATVTLLGLKDAWIIHLERERERERERENERERDS